MNVDRHLDNKDESINYVEDILNELHPCRICIDEEIKENILKFSINYIYLYQRQKNQ